MSNLPVLIVDFNHMAYSYAFSGLSLSSSIDGEVVDTTVAYGTIKNIANWSKFGKCPTAICFDRPCKPRKHYFQTLYGEDKTAQYKGQREKMGGELYRAIGIAERILRNGGVTCLAKDGYEADDLVYGAIVGAYKKYPDSPIHVVTGDSDLIPLVNDRISVFMRSRKGTWAEDSEYKKNKYIQITPKNYTQALADMSAYKEFTIPYNYLLLIKLLRGDKSDNVRGDLKAFPPRRVKAIFDKLQEVGYPGIRYSIKGTEINALLKVLKEHCDFTEDELAHVFTTYVGINLDQEYVSEDPECARQSIFANNVSEFSMNNLRIEANKFGIHNL